MKYLFGCLLSLLVCVTATPSWAALSYVGGQCGAFAGTLSDQSINFALTGGSDAAPIIGDLVIVGYAIAAGSDVTMVIDNPSGTDYTLLGAELYANDTEDINLRAGYRVMPDPTETSFTLSAVGGGTGDVTRAGGYCVKVLRGQHGTPLEQAVQEGTAVDTILVDPGSITPTTAGTWVLTFGAGASTNVSNNFASSDLTAFQESNQDDGRAVQIGAGYTEWTSGAFAPATWTYGGTDSANYSHAWKIIAIKPAEAPVSAVDAGNAGAIMLLLGR